jgi:UDP-2,3-diacylglucosamine pyrophosphatase LpxH
MHTHKNAATGLASGQLESTLEPAVTKVARSVYIISDIHLGGAYPESNDPEDRGFRICTHVGRLTEFIQELAARPFGSPRVELVINGDLVDFLAEREPSEPPWVPFTSDPMRAAAKLETMISRDRVFFSTLGEFLARGHRLVLLLGNHDIELAFPTVRRTLATALGVEGHHDYEFLYDGEGYSVGEVLVEHGNRYDSFNVVNHDALRRVRSLQSRRQSVPAKYVFESPAGSQMVADVINRIKADYRFVDLLKPETGAVIPILLALEPRYRSVLGRVARLALVARRHGLRGPALPFLGEDIAADRSASAAGAFGDDLAWSGDPTLGSTSALNQILKEVLGETVEEFEAGVGGTGNASEIGSDISAHWDLNRTLGLLQMLTGRGSGDIEGRLKSLMKAVRAIQDDRSFDRSSEGAGEYLDAARDLARAGFRCVTFGHTHLAKQVPIEGGSLYINSGTWADLIQFPKHIFAGTDTQALEGLRDFVGDLHAGRLSAWIRFAPTYVQIELDSQGRILSAQLRDYGPDDRVAPVDLNSHGS